MLILSLVNLIIGGGVILDRSVFSDYVFACVGRNQGFITKEGESSRIYAILSEIYSILFASRIRRV